MKILKEVKCLGVCLKGVRGGGRMGGFGIDLKCKISLIFLSILPDPYTQGLFQTAHQINVQYTLYS